MNIIQHPSPNFDSREGQRVDMLVLHYTGMRSGAAALDRMCEAAAKVSAHYMVELDGTIYQLVDENNRAWHAGVSSWHAKTNINQRSIGIEIVNRGHEFGYTPFPRPQMQAVVALCKEILNRHEIPPGNVVGHSDVAPARKQDPGELFDWKLLADCGIGLFPSQAQIFQASYVSPSALFQYGYDTNDFTSTITAFQRHFRPKKITGIWDDECGKTLAALLAML